MKANYKQLKVVLALRIRKLGLFFLADFWDLNNFSPFKFPNLDNFYLFDNLPIFDNFPYFLINLSPPSISPTLLVASISLVTNIYNDTIVFSIDINNITILLKSWINYQEKLAKPKKIWTSHINFSLNHFLTTSIFWPLY